MKIEIIVDGERLAEKDTDLVIVGFCNKEGVSLRGFGEGSLKAHEGLMLEANFILGCIANFLEKTGPESVADELRQPFITLLEKIDLLEERDRNRVVN